jgi:hypothetical protein
VKAGPLLAELARHVFTLTNGGASISLPLATETDLCLAIQQLGDLATPPEVGEEGRGIRLLRTHI